MKSLIFLFLIGINLKLFSQGCSDAGFCTMGALRPDQSYNKDLDIKLRSIELNFYRGNNQFISRIDLGTVDLNIGINDRSSFQIKIPYQYVSGSMGENQGLGDISLSYTTSFWMKKGWRLNGTLGTKIPSTDSNDGVSNTYTENKSAPLPMYYQVSLGSYDAIAGLSIINKKWLFATGVQIALTENRNQFQRSDWPAFPDQGDLTRYNEGKILKRGIDVVLRAERNWRFTNYNFSLGLLNIYRVTKDEVEGREGSRKKLNGTTGPITSAIASFGYHFDTKNSVKIIQGIYLVRLRDISLDGLIRDNVLSVSYIYKF